MIKGCSHFVSVLAKSVDHYSTLLFDYDYRLFWCFLPKRGKMLCRGAAQIALLVTEYMVLSCHNN